jgi:hypothetical protein
MFLDLRASDLSGGTGSQISVLVRDVEASFRLVGYILMEQQTQSDLLGDNVFYSRVIDQDKRSVTTVDKSQ